jgi:hypothetical protein
MRHILNPDEQTREAGVTIATTAAALGRVLVGANFALNGLVSTSTVSSYRDFRESSYLRDLFLGYSTAS